MRKCTKIKSIGIFQAVRTARNKNQINNLGGSVEITMIPIGEFYINLFINELKNKSIFKMRMPLLREGFQSLFAVLLLFYVLAHS